jgi:hypothetical protein
MPVRVEAIRLLDRANAVSHPNHMMPIQRIDVTFRAYALDGTAKDGTASTMISGDIERYEQFFGAYHAIGIHFPDKIVQGQYQPPPPETSELDALTPLLIGQFDNSDTIHSITPATLFGRPAKCIQFETVNGRTHQSNEICVDSELGNIVRRNVGEDLVEDSDFSSFEGILVPTHIRHYINGKLRMEIEQKFSVIDGPIDWAALAPPNPTTLRTCKQYAAPSFSPPHSRPPRALAPGMTSRCTASLATTAASTNLPSCRPAETISRSKPFTSSPSGLFLPACATESPFP